MSISSLQFFYQLLHSRTVQYCHSAYTISIFNQLQVFIYLLKHVCVHIYTYIPISFMRNSLIFPQTDFLQASVSLV